MAAKPEALAPGVYRVYAVAVPNAISVFLIEEGGGLTLIDTGIPGSGGRIASALAALGAAPTDLKRILLTHQHGDDVGGLPEIRWWASDAEVVASEHEGRVISGRQEPDPPSIPLFRPLAARQRPAPSPVGGVVREGDVVAGFRVIPTPGHTMGHLSLLRETDGLLIAGDALGNLGPLGVKVGVLKAFCADPPAAKRSAARLLAEPFVIVAFAHGRPLCAGAKEAVRAAVARCRYDAA